MSLIKSSVDENQLRRFFVEQLIPLALKLSGDNIRFFALGPDSKTEGADDDSWYVIYPEDSIELIEFDSDNLEVELRNLWETQGLSQMGELAKPIAELAKQLEMPTPSNEANVSPFLYVMF